jgi:hypothetical protein
MTVAVLRGLTRNRAETAEDAPDRRLRGRTYAIPFDQVWTAALLLARKRRGWTVLRADDIEGAIQAEARTALRFTHDVQIRVGLDGDGQTRVDLVSASRVGHADLGKNARRIGWYLRALDRELEALRRGAAPRNHAAHMA